MEGLNKNGETNPLMAAYEPVWVLIPNTHIIKYLEIISVTDTHTDWVCGNINYFKRILGSGSLFISHLSETHKNIYRLNKVCFASK